MSEFKSTVGTFYTKALFHEVAGTDKSRVVYTLQNEDRGEYPSLYRLYMEMGDLTEYEFANEYLGGWSHWKLLCSLVWFKPYVELWREELFLRVQAKALYELQKSGTFSTNKYLLERGWEPKKTKGRPSKETIKEEAKKIRDEFMEDAARIGLN